jgi:hypothetical protein
MRCKQNSILLLCFLTAHFLCTIKLAKAASSLADSSINKAPVSWKDTTRRFQPFRVLAITDTSLQTRQEKTSDQFYESLQNFFYQNQLSRKIFDLLVVPPSKVSPPPEKKEQPAERFQSYNGKIIGDIQFRKLPLFGPSVTDTSKTAPNWFQQTGNRLHSPTRTWVLRKNMLIEKGDSLQPFQLSDNERVLRQLSFIRDARLYLQPRAGEEESDTVDVLVITQDYFPYAAGGSYGGFDDLSLRIANGNLAGLGHHFSNELRYNDYLNPKFGYRGVYTVPNLAGLFINSQLEFTHTALEQQQGLYLRRNFYTPDVEWAGGLHLRQTRVKRPVLFLDASRDTLLRYQYTYSNVWLARAFSLSPEPASASSSRARLILAARFTSTKYSERPPIAESKQQFFHHRKLLMGSIGLNSRKYFRDQYIFGFGRTEDVPTGYLSNLRFGYEDSEFARRPYLGLQLQGAHYFRWFGYLRGELDAESYFKQEGGTEQRLLHMQTTYFSPLLEWSNFHFRQLISIDYTYGDRRFDHEFLTIGYDNIRGFSSYEERGTQRFSLRLETISFTPFYLLGFQLAGFGFADFAILNRKNYFNLKGQSFQGYGLGLRVRNDHLTFNTFQIRAIVYPNTPGKSFSISVSGVPSQLFSDFEVGEPLPFLFR